MIKTIEERGLSARREEALDGLRLLLTLLVIMVHSGALYSEAVRSLIYLGGSFRIPALFALSGFVLYLPTAHLPTVRLKYGVAEFWRRRALRLLPAYWAMLLIASARCAYVAYRAHDPEQQALGFSYVWKGLWWHIPLAHNFSGDPGIVVTPDYNVSWTLGVECALSVVFPFLILAIARFGWWMVFAAVLFVNTPWGYSLKLFGGRLPDVIPSGYLLVFLCGVFFARLARNEGLMANSRFSIGLLVAGALIFLPRFLYLPWLESKGPKILEESSPWRNLVEQMPAIDVALVGLSTSAFCAFLVLRPRGLAAKMLSLTPLRVLAPVSYCLYLMHVPIFTGWHMMSHRFHVSPTGWVSLMMSWILTSISAYALHRWVEVPFRRMSRRGESEAGSPSEFRENPAVESRCRAN